MVVIWCGCSGFSRVAQMAYGYQGLVSLVLQCFFLDSSGGPGYPSVQRCLNTDNPLLLPGVAYIAFGGGWSGGNAPHQCICS